MARKKELMELENPSMEGNTPVETADTEAGVSPAKRMAHRLKRTGTAWT